MKRKRQLPERVRAALERRRSGAAGRHKQKETRPAEKRRAIQRERRES